MVKADSITIMGTLNYIFIAGPITLDSRNNKVYIVPDIEIKLSQDEFDSLYILAVRENTTLSFEMIYDAVWEKDDGFDRRDEACFALLKVVRKINSAGDGFVQIDCNPLTGFTFRTKWAHDYES